MKQIPEKSEYCMSETIKIYFNLSVTLRKALI